MSYLREVDLNDVIKPVFYTALRPLNFRCALIFQKLLSQYLQHAMLYVQPNNWPDRLLRIEFHENGKATYTPIPLSDLPQEAEEHRVTRNRRVSVRNVIIKMNMFNHGKYSLFESIRRAISQDFFEDLTERNNCHTFVDEMISWLTGQEDFVSSKLRMAKRPQILQILVLQIIC